MSGRIARDPTPMIAIVLAAGRSTRMGRPKLHLPWGQTTILGQVLDTLRAAAIDDIVVAVRRGDGAAARAAEARGADVAWIVVDDGLPTVSLQGALVHITSSQPTSGDRSVLVMPGDMPLVAPSTVTHLVAAFLDTLEGSDGHSGVVADAGQRIVAPAYGRRRGHPVIFGAAHVPALLALGPGARPRDVVISAKAAGHVRLVAVEDAGVVTDIDDAAAYERWRPG